MTPLRDFSKVAPNALKRSLGTLCLLALVLCGCHTQLYSHTDSDHGVTVSFPGNVDLFSDKDALSQQLSQETTVEKPVDAPELLFVLSTPQQSRVTCSLHQLPKGAELTPEEYYQASTAQELERLGVDIVEPKTDIDLDSRPFQRVGFTLQSEGPALRSRIYQHLDPKSGRVAVLTATALSEHWERELPTLETIVHSIRLNW